MPNSYTTVPSIIPGNLTVQGNLVATGAETLGGNLSVNGSTIASETTALNSARHSRLTFDGSVGEALTFNLQSNLATRDSTILPAYALVHDPTAGKFFWRLVNAAGNASDMSPRMAMFTDYVQHVNTGNTTENTIYSKVIRAGLLGSNGGVRVTLAYSATVQGATGSHVRVRFGSVVAYDSLVATTGNLYQQTNILAQNATNAQAFATMLTKDTAVLDTNLGVTAAQDLTADVLLTVTAQCGTATDNQVFRFCEVELLNTFGPV